jgi:hypothetical protein
VIGGWQITNDHKVGPSLMICPSKMGAKKNSFVIYPRRVSFICVTDIEFSRDEWKGSSLILLIIWFLSAPVYDISGTVTLTAVCDIEFGIDRLPPSLSMIYKN